VNLVRNIAKYGNFSRDKETKYGPFETKFRLGPNGQPSSSSCSFLAVFPFLAARGWGSPVEPFSRVTTPPLTLATSAIKTRVYHFPGRSQGEEPFIVSFFRQATYLVLFRASTGRSTLQQSTCLSHGKLSVQVSTPLPSVREPRLIICYLRIRCFFS